MFPKHGNLVDADASGTKASAKHLESRLEIIQGHAFWDHWKADKVGFKVGNFEGKVWISPFSITSLSFGAPFLENPREVECFEWNSWHKNRVWYEIAIQGHRSFILPPIVSVYLHSNVSEWWAPWNASFLQACVSAVSKVIDFGANRKRICDFLLVRHGNIGAILHRFRYIAGFMHPIPIPS